MEDFEEVVWDWKGNHLRVKVLFSSAGLATQILVNDIEKEEEELRKKVINAREIIKNIEVSENIMRAVASACIRLHVDGHRPDISTIRASKALAAIEERKSVTFEDIMKVSIMAVGYRTRGFGFEEPAKPEVIREAFADAMKIVQRI